MRFHRNEEAQVSFLAVAASLCFIGLLAMTINTNDLASERVRMQDVSDTMVVSAAAWSARGLNLVSFINVLNSKLISAAVLLNSLNDTLPVLIGIAEAQRAVFQACSGVPFVGAFCAAMAVVVNVQLQVLKALKSKIVTPAAKKFSICSQGLFWKTMNNVLQKIPPIIRTTFIPIAMAESYDIASKNGATGLVVNGRVLSTSPQEGAVLPIDEKSFSQYCPYVQSGGSGYKLQGYDCGEGPLKLGRSRMTKMLIPFTNLFAQPIFKGMVKKNLVQVGCGGAQGAEEKIPVKLASLPECRSANVTAKWSRMTSRTFRIENGNLTVNDFIPWQPLDKGGGDASDAQDLDGIEGINVGDADIDLGSGSGDDASDLDFKQGYKALDPDSESSGPLVSAACRAGNSRSGYPQYNLAISNLAMCFSFGCDNIKNLSQFVWVGGGQTPGGSEIKGGYFIRVLDKKEFDATEENPKKTYEYTIETVVLVDAGEKLMTQKEFDEYLKKHKGVNAEGGGTGSEGCTKPKPYMLEKDKPGYANRMRFIGLVEKDIVPPFWSTFFTNPPEKMIAYSQAQVYNHLQEDTFTQDWRVRLEHATLLEEFLKSDKSQGKGSSVKSKPGLLETVLGTVNNH
jgi:hypothetical protein